jgi:hypothetical protein
MKSKYWDKVQTGMWIKNNVPYPDTKLPEKVKDGIEKFHKQVDVLIEKRKNINE